MKHGWGEVEGGLIQSHSGDDERARPGRPGSTPQGENIKISSERILLFFCVVTRPVNRQNECSLILKAILAREHGEKRW